RSSGLTSTNPAAAKRAMLKARSQSPGDKEPSRPSRSALERDSSSGSGIAMGLTQECMTPGRRRVDAPAKPFLRVLPRWLGSRTRYPKPTWRTDMGTEVEETSKEHHQPIEIVVNGEPKVVSTHRLTFEDVVRLAFDDAVFNENIVYTVTYKRGPQQNREGTLVAGEAVFITHGKNIIAKL